MAEKSLILPIWQARSVIKVAFKRTMVLAHSDEYNVYYRYVDGALVVLLK